MPSKNFDSFVMTHCLFAELLPGRALWIPYGWRCVLLTRAQLSVSHALHIPYVSTRMLQASACKNDIITFAEQAMQERGSSMGEPCLSFAEEAVVWLNMVGTLEDELVNPSPVTPIGIEDARE
jgi:hypothetical protein